MKLWIVTGSVAAGALAVLLVGWWRHANRELESLYQQKRKAWGDISADLKRLRRESQ